MLYINLTLTKNTVFNMYTDFGIYNLVMFNNLNILLITINLPVLFLETIFLI